MHYSLVKDIGILLLSAGIAGVICKRMGLSVIVGYLLAGVFIGPHTPITFITDEVRVRELSEIGLVFVMFAIGLHLSLTKIAKMGAGIIVATGLGALFMYQFTLMLGYAMDWTHSQSLFIAAMLMVSSSAVIAKVMEELNLAHNKTAQMALTITIVEDVVAVIMLTILGTVSAGSGDDSLGAGQLGSVVTQISAYVVLILMTSLLFLPKVLRRLDMTGDAELRVVAIAGLLLLLAFCATLAGYSLALGAFLFGAIIAELPQKELIEKSFGGVRGIFSSIFFVSIGMMIEPALLLDTWLIVVILVCFSLFVRPIACGLALILVGVPPHDARRGGMLLTPLGEFTFIIAQAGITAGILGKEYYPVAVAISIFTVLATPILNRYAVPIIAFSERIEPKWITKALMAYHDWLMQIRNRPGPSPVWKIIRPQAGRVIVEMLLITGIIVFFGPISGAVEKQIFTAAGEQRLGEWFLWLTPGIFEVSFRIVLGLFLLIPLFALWRSIVAMSLILSETMRTHRLPRALLNAGFKTGAALAICYWFAWAFQLDRFKYAPWIWAAIIGSTVVIIAVFSRRLIYWHSAWQHAMQTTLSGHVSAAELRAEAKENLDRGLGSWDIVLEECEIPDNAVSLGKTLHAIAIPARFGASIVEIARNGHSILTPGPDMRLYPGDKILLLGKISELKAAREFLETRDSAGVKPEVFGRAVLETSRVGKSPRTDRSFAELQIAKNTGVRVVGIQRGDKKIINPTGKEVLCEGDDLLLVGTIEQTRRFAEWLAGKGGQEPEAHAGEIQNAS